MDTPEINREFELASHFVQYTRQSVFITGKAGTGKTTFLRHIYQLSLKNTAIVAPTGVAAINAGGATIHSFFQLPFKAFLPTNKNTAQNSAQGFCDLNSFFAEARYNQEKINLYRSLEQLIIDEVSMVRADTMDAIDLVLRRFRKSEEPFGGVQLVLIGDLYQLPPVTKQDQWPTLQSYYASPYFFESKAIQKLNLEIVELKKIYRQQDDRFIEILNRIRTNKSLPEDLAYLNSFLNTSFRPAPDENYITLTTHNEKSDATNRFQLSKLPGTSRKYRAITQGEFPDRNYPADVVLELKIGAQVMFIRNDRSSDKKFYNGMLAKITELDEDTITLQPFAEQPPLRIERETWQHVRYSYSEQSREIEQEVLGEFIQFPLRLAWAITIHKSQGLTFSRAIIDAGESFAPGQVYVALSRLSSTKELVLKSKISDKEIMVDACLEKFLTNQKKDSELETLLQKEKKQFLTSHIRNAFSLISLQDDIKEHLLVLAQKSEAVQSICQPVLTNVRARLQTLQDTSEKLNVLLLELENQSVLDIQHKVLDKCLKGVPFYSNILTTLQKELISLSENILYLKGIRGYIKELIHLSFRFNDKLLELNKAKIFATGMLNNSSIEALREKEVKSSEQLKKQLAIQLKMPKLKTGDTQRISLQLFKEGKDIEKIASIRSLTPGTIETHLVSFMKSGEIKLSDLVSDEEVRIIELAMDEVSKNPEQKIIDLVGSTITYGKIRAVKENILINQKSTIENKDKNKLNTYKSTN